MSGRRLALTLLLLVVLTPLAAVVGYLALARGGPRPEMARRSPMAVREVTWTPEPMQWAEDLGDAGTPRDPHTSMAMLEAFIAQAVSADVAKVGENTPVKITANEEAASVAQVLRDRLSVRGGELLSGDAPAGAVTVAPEGLDASAGPERATPLVTEVSVSWRNLRHAEVPWWPTPIKTGELVAYVEGPKGTATTTAKLDEKPWLSTPPGAVGRTYYAVVVAGSPAASASEAREQARRMSVDALVQRLDANTQSMRGSRVPKGELRRQAEQAVIVGGAVVDQCVVSVARPYGPVYYAANLVDVRPDRLEPLARAAVYRERTHQRTLVGVLVGLPGMMLVLGVVYLGLNALTRGYFRTHLRAAALVAVAVVVLIAVGIVLG